LFEKKIRITVLDATVLLIVTTAGVYLVYRIQAGLHYRWHWSAIPQYLFRFDTVAGSWKPNVLILGLLTTIRLSIWATLLATIIGTVMGLLRVSSGLFNRLIGGTYVEIVRNLPPLVLVFIFYFFIGDQILPALGIESLVSGISGAGRSLLRVLFAPPALLVPFLSALVTLAVFEGAYITEIVRSGIQSIETGQWEAAAALGLTKSQQMRHIVLPQAVQRILPPLAGQFISTIKDSAIVSVISIQELTFQGMELMATTYFTFEIWITITGLYLLLTLSCSLAVERLEIRLRKGRAVGRH
jgi:polar amino acid transport system permease protein